MTWKTVKLKEVISHRKGFIEINDETEYKLVTVKLHRKGVFPRENLKGFQIRTKKQQVCKAGDFIVAEMDAKVGGYGFIPDYLEGAIVSSHYFLFEVDENKLRPQYLEVMSQLKILQEQIKAVGSTNYAAIRPYHVLDWEIPLPPIEKQKEIEFLFLKAKSIIETIDQNLIEQLSLIENLNQAILQEAVQGKLVAQDPGDEPASELLKRIKAEKAKSGKKEKPLPPIKPEEIPFEIPENWVWCRLGEIVDKIAGGGTPSKINAFFWNGNIPWASVKDLKGKFLYDTLDKITEIAISSSSTNLIPANNIIVCTRMGLGKICINKVDTAINQDLKAIFLNKNIEQEYFYYYYKTLKIVGSGMTVNGIKQEQLLNFLLPLPPLSEQKRIVEEIEKQMEKTKQLKEHILGSQKATEQLLKALLREAFEGEKD